MRSWILPLVLAACASQQQVDELEARVRALEEKTAAQKPGPPGAPATPATPANPEETAAATALLQEAQQAVQAADYETAKAKLGELQAKFPSTPAARSSAKILQEIQIVGAPAAALEVEKWMQGRTELDAKPATLLVFWEVWCPHCKREMPNMQPLSERWSSKGLQVVGLTKVTKSATEEAVMQFVSQNNIQFPIAKEKDGSLSRAYGVSGVPAAALVKDGKVVWRGHPGRLTDDLIEKHLAPKG